MKALTQRCIEAHLAKARSKHPVFAADRATGLIVMGEEYGELCRAELDKTSKAKRRSEAFDLIAAAIRYVEELEDA